jgi:hypothetical protein
MYVHVCVINVDGGLPDTFRGPPFQLPLLFPFAVSGAGDLMLGTCSVCNGYQGSIVQSKA